MEGYLKGRGQQAFSCHCELNPIYIPCMGPSECILPCIHKAYAKLTSAYCLSCTRLRNHLPHPEICEEGKGLLESV